MALTWGAWHYTGGNGMRVGIDNVRSSPLDPNMTFWQVDFDLYTENQYNYSGDVTTFNYTGCSGNSSFQFTNSSPTGSGAVIRGTRSCIHNYTTWGDSPGTFTISASISAAYNGSTPSHSMTVQIPGRPIYPSYAPTNVVATRNSDSQVVVSGVHPVDASHPNHYMEILQSTFSETGVQAPAQVIYHGGGSAYTVNGLAGNRMYHFGMRLGNTAGASGDVYTPDYTYMTPSAPTSVAATPSGGKVVVTWASSAYPHASITHKVERKVGAGAWTPMASGIPQGTLTWTDNAPGGTNYYRVATQTSREGVLSSSWVEANVVQTCDCWVWDGAAAQPANMFLWNGTAELPMTIDKQLYVR